MNIVPDTEFLLWLWNRLVHKYGENPGQDFMMRLNNISSRISSLQYRAAELTDDNPRCYCPDCNADLGNFYSNRIRMVRPEKPTVAPMQGPLRQP